LPHSLLRRKPIQHNSTHHADVGCCRQLFLHGSRCHILTPASRALLPAALLPALAALHWSCTNPSHVDPSIGTEIACNKVSAISLETNSKLSIGR
jgi:hypothetical protein